MPYSEEFESLLRKMRREHGYDKGTLMAFKKAIADGYDEDDLIVERKKNEPRFKHQVSHSDFIIDL